MVDAKPIHPGRAGAAIWQDQLTGQDTDIELSQTARLTHI